MQFFKKKEIISERGFTLMEAMVTVAIIAIMSAVYLASYRSTNEKIILDQTAAGIMSDLRYAQNMSMNVKKFNDEIPCGGYGININSATSYVIFADKDGDVSTPACDNSKSYDMPAEKISDRALPARVNVITSSSFSNLTFQPPNPIIWVEGLSAASATISLQYGDGSSGLIKTITINGYTGQISVSN